MHYTVKQLAEQVGVSVRTLHHYDAIGLLRPSRSHGNGYRLYAMDDLLRLQHILVYREMDIPLSEIASLLDADNNESLAVLRRQRQLVADRADHLVRVIATLDATIAALENAAPLNADNLYRGVVSAEKQAAYEQWLIAHYGEAVEPMMTDSFAAASRKEGAMEQLRTIEAGLVAAMKASTPPQAASLEPLLMRHRDWVAKMWGQACDRKAYGLLADAYRHPDFRARYEALGEGFTDYLISAMQASARRIDEG